VHVASVTRLEPQVAEVAISWTETASEMVKKWGGTAALGLLAVWGLWMLGRNAPKVALATDGQASSAATAAAEEADALPGPPPTRRDLLQAFVRDNPEATAAVIGKWVQAAK
jgi:hypothetical protein